MVVFVKRKIESHWDTYPRGQGNAQIQRFLFPSVQGGYGTLGVTLVRSQLRTDPRLQILGVF